MRAARTLIVAALAAGLCACANLKAAPPPLRPDTPARFAEAEPEAAGGPADLALWWTGFHDPILDDLVGRALHGNLDLQQTAARIDEARQQEIIAGARRLPSAQVDSSAGRNRISEHAIPLPPGAGQGGGHAPSPFGIPGSEFNSFRLGLDASWELDLFGGARSGLKAASARREAAEWSRRDLQVALAAETAAHYLSLRALQQREAIAWRELSRQRELLSIVSSRADAGLISHLDVSQQQALVDIAEAKAYPIEARIRAEIHALGVLVGEPPEALITTLTPVAAAPTPPPAPPPGLPSELLRRRPDIRRAEREVAASAADVGVATADLYPKITLSAQPSLVSTALSSLIDWGSRNYTLSAGLLWPIFDGGRLKAQLAGANARQSEALISYRKAVLTGLLDVEDSLSLYQADEARRGSLAAALEEARRAEALARDQYGSGVVGYANVLAAQQAVIGDEDQLADAEAARSQDVVGLYKVLGGGWRQEDLQGNKP